MKKVISLFTVLTLMGCSGARPEMSTKNRQLNAAKKINAGYVFSDENIYREEDYSRYGYSKDDKNVYREGELVKELEPETFQIIIDRIAGDCSGFFARDVDSLFFDNLNSLESIRDIDIQPFQVSDMGIAHYYKNKNSVYIFGPNWGGCATTFKKIEDADPNTFEYLGYFYAKDKNHVYLVEKIIEDADVNSFEFLSEGYGYAKDENNVYRRGGKVAGADPKTFVPTK